MPTSPVDRYIAETVDRIEDFVQLKDPDRLRLWDDLRTTILQRLGDAPIAEQIVSELGSPTDWAQDFAENSELPKTVFSTNYINRRSKTELFGLPLVHVIRGTRNGKVQVARGILAVGNFAVGVVAIGDTAIGGFAFGGFAAGLISFGGFSLALLLAIGGFAAGGIAYGGFAAGLFAYGGFAFGYYVLGGFAAGHTAIGGAVYAVEGAGGSANVLVPLAKDHWLFHLNSLRGTVFVPLCTIFVLLSVGHVIKGLVCRWGKQKPSDE